MGRVSIGAVKRYEANGGRWVSQMASRLDDLGMADWEIRASRSERDERDLITVSVVHEDAVGALSRTLSAAAWLDSDAGRAWYAAFCAEPIVAEESADV